MLDTGNQCANNYLEYFDPALPRPHCFDRDFMVGWTRTHYGLGLGCHSQRQASYAIDEDQVTVNDNISTDLII